MRVWKLAASVAGLAMLCVAGCGDRPVVYKQGQYQGKVDGIPWENAQFKGSRVEWERAIKARNQGQDEYSRATPSAR